MEEEKLYWRTFDEVSIVNREFCYQQNSVTNDFLSYLP